MDFIMFNLIKSSPNNQKLSHSNPPSYLQKGFTFVELLTAIAITSLLASIAIPNMSDFIVKLRVNNEISTLKRLLFVTRNSAINSGQRVILCPLTDGGTCTTDWGNSLSVFIDTNNNKRYDSANNEVLLVKKPAIKDGDILIYGKNRTKITYKPSGHLSGLSNGTLRYCPLNNQDKSRGIVIARSGRIYASSDVDNDGKDETRMNKEITCN
jgi:type IV fimbrial biogenesis protein FimT